MGGGLLGFMAVGSGVLASGRRLWLGTILFEGMESLTDCIGLRSCRNPYFVSQEEDMNGW